MVHHLCHCVQMRERVRERMIFRQHGKTPWDVVASDRVAREGGAADGECAGPATAHGANVDLEGYEWHTLFEAPKHDEVCSRRITCCEAPKWLTHALAYSLAAWLTG
jgi:hypothetical protein